MYIHFIVTSPSLSRESCLEIERKNDDEEVAKAVESTQERSLDGTDRQDSIIIEEDKEKEKRRRRKRGRRRRKRRKKKRTKKTSRQINLKRIRPNFFRFFHLLCQMD